MRVTRTSLVFALFAVPVLAQDRQEERIADAAIEGKLKKLLAQAREAQPAERGAK
jgi:hypothetical protein